MSQSTSQANKYAPLAWQVPAWRDTSPVLLLTGSAGGGKSRLAAEKVHAYLLRYPKATALVFRKTRVSITNSTAATLAKIVIGEDAPVRHVPSLSRFDYNNGSTLIYAGMDGPEQRTRIRSIDADIAWLEEASEFSEEDYNEVQARLRGKRGGFRQVILSTNPDSAGHWINTRLILGGEAAVYSSGASDNPYNPADYTARLAMLTGIEGQRLREGVWSDAVGQVYDTYSDTGNVADVTYNPDLPIIWAVDDGYSGELDPRTRTYTEQSHPRAFLICQMSATGTLHVLAEHYAARVLEDQHILDVLALDYPNPAYAVIDSAAAQLRARVQAHGIPVKKGKHAVEEGIKELRRWFAPDGNGVRRVLIHPSCRHLRFEAQNYRYDHNSVPRKAHDHGLDALRYLVWRLKYEV